MQMLGQETPTAHRAAGRQQSPCATLCSSNDQAFSNYQAGCGSPLGELDGSTGRLRRSFNKRRRCPPNGSETFLDRETDTFPSAQHRSVTHDCRRTRWSTRDSGDLWAQHNWSFDTPHPAASHDELYVPVSATGDDSDDCMWSTATCTDSSSGASDNMQLSMVNEAHRWFPHTDFYAKMKAGARHQVDKKHEHNDEVTGRLRIGGSIFSLLVFISITQRQSTLGDIPLAALRMGGVGFIACVFLLSCLCSLPLMVADVALGQTAQGSVLRALDCLNRRLRGVGLAVVICCGVSAIAHSFSSSLIMHFIGASYGTLASWRDSRNLQGVCESLSAADCAADTWCSLTVQGDCVPALDRSINSVWLYFLSSSDAAAKVVNIICCLTIWLIVTYTITQAPRLVGIVGACAFPSLLVLMPALVLMEQASNHQKYGTCDFFKLPWQPISADDAYYGFLFIPLLVYLPGDGTILTFASFDKLSHNPILTSLVCFGAKWCIAALLLHVMYYAEGLATSQNAFEGVAVHPSLRMTTTGSLGNEAIPVLSYSVYRMWPTSWFVGLLSFGAIFLQGFSGCCSYTMAQWALLQEMRWINRPAKARSQPALKGDISPPAPPARIQEVDAAPAEQQDGVGQSAEKLHGISVLHAAPTGSSTAGGGSSGPRGGSIVASVLRKRHSGRTQKSGSSRFGDEKNESYFSRIQRLLRVTGRPHEEEDVDKLLSMQGRTGNFKPGANGDSLLSWWGGPESESQERLRRSDMTSTGLSKYKLLVCLIAFGPAAIFSVLLLCISLPVNATDKQVVRAPIHYLIMVHADFFLRLLLGTIKFVYIAWLFGSREQAQRVGILPLLVLNFGVIASTSVLLLRTVFPFDVSVSACLLFGLPLAFIGLTILIVTVQTALLLRQILAQGKGPSERRKSHGEAGGQRTGLKRLGARSLSLLEPLHYAPYLRYGTSSGAISADGQFVADVGRPSMERSLRRPGHHGQHPSKLMHRTVHETRERAAKQKHHGRQKNSRVRRIIYVTKLFVRLLKSNLYWTFIGNVEILRADLNMALSGNPSKPIPMIWGWFFKFLATPWLLVNLMEYSVGTIPMVLAHAEGPHTALSYLTLIWILLIVGLALFGVFFPDYLEPFLPHRTLQFPRCWVPRVSCCYRFSFLDDINPKLFDSKAYFGFRRACSSRR